MDIIFDKRDLNCFGFADCFFTVQAFGDGYIISTDFGFGITCSNRISGEQAERFIRSLQPVSEQGEHEIGKSGERCGQNAAGTGSGTFEHYDKLKGLKPHRTPKQ